MDDLEIPVFSEQIAKQIAEERLADLRRSQLEPSFAAKRCALVARRHAQKLKATPSWANWAKIEGTYALAALKTRVLGVKHVVDHIVPLQHKKVCGLHCENNLRVITAFENSKKKNRFLNDGELPFPKLAPTLHGRQFDYQLSDFVETRP